MRSAGINFDDSIKTCGTLINFSKSKGVANKKNREKVSEIIRNLSTLKKPEDQQKYNLWKIEFFIIFEGIVKIFAEKIMVNGK